MQPPSDPTATMCYVQGEEAEDGQHPDVGNAAAHNDCSYDGPGQPAAGSSPAACMAGSPAPHAAASPAARAAASSSKPSLHGMHSNDMSAGGYASPVQLGTQPLPPPPQQQQQQPAPSFVQPRGFQLVSPRLAVSDPPHSPPFTTLQQPAAQQQPSAAVMGPQAMQEACWRLPHDSQAAQLAVSGRGCMLVLMM